MAEFSKIYAELSNAFENCFERNNLPNTGTLAEDSIKNAFQPPLTKWRDAQYTSGVPSIPLIAYVLPGGSQSNANRGASGLTQPAATILNSLAPVARDLGFSVFTATLVKKVLGVPHEDHFTYEFVPSHYKRRRLGFDDDAYVAWCERKRHGPQYHENPAEDLWHYKHGDYDTPPVGEVLKEKLLLYDLVSVDGSNALSSNIGSVRIKRGNLIAARDEFLGSHPQQERFYRSTGEIILTYERCVIALCPLREETALVIALKDSLWALGWLGPPDTPDARAVAVVSAVMRRLDERELRMRPKRAKWWNENPATMILAHATAWKDHVLWVRAMRHCQDTAMIQLIPATRVALEVFGVELIRDGLVSLMKSPGTLTQRYELICMIASKSQEGNVERYIRELWHQALSLCTRPTLEDVPILVSMTRTSGPTAILLVIPNIEKRGTYEALMALAKSLYELHQSTDTSVDNKVHLMDATRQCLSAVAPQWECGIDVEAWREYSASDVLTTENDATNRICEIVAFCHKLNHLQPCIELFHSLCQFKLKPEAYIISRLRKVHAPLATQLRTTLTGLSKPGYAETFASFYRDSISLYLAHGLPPKADLPPLPLTAIGCGCKDCTQLDTFLRGSRDVTYFRASQARRAHVEAQILREKTYLEHYVTTRTMEHGSPYMLSVYKCDEVMAALRWRKQQKHAESFVNCVCPDEQSLREVMGGRYDDVVGALQGTRVFVLGDLELLGDGLGLRSESDKGTARVVGTKRKHS